MRTSINDEGFAAGLQTTEWSWPFLNRVLPGAVRFRGPTLLQRLRPSVLRDFQAAILRLPHALPQEASSLPRSVDLSLASSLSPLSSAKTVHYIAPDPSYHEDQKRAISRRISRETLRCCSTLRGVAALIKGQRFASSAMLRIKYATASSVSRGCIGMVTDRSAMPSATGNCPFLKPRFLNAVE